MPVIVYDIDEKCKSQPQLHKKELCVAKSALS